MWKPWVDAYIGSNRYLKCLTPGSVENRVCILVSCPTPPETTKRKFAGVNITFISKNTEEIIEKKRSCRLPLINFR